jgi:hypothetical protein
MQEHSAMTTTQPGPYKAYEFYCQQRRLKYKTNAAAGQHHLIVSKKYFEKIYNENKF